MVFMLLYLIAAGMDCFDSNNMLTIYKQSQSLALYQPLNLTLSPLCLSFVNTVLQIDVKTGTDVTVASTVLHNFTPSLNKSFLVEFGFNPSKFVDINSDILNVHYKISDTASLFPVDQQLVVNTDSGRCWSKAWIVYSTIANENFIDLHAIHQGCNYFGSGANMYITYDLDDEEEFLQFPFDENEFTVGQEGSWRVDIHSVQSSQRESYLKFLNHIIKFRLFPSEMRIQFHFLINVTQTLLVDFSEIGEYRISNLVRDNSAVLYIYNQKIYVWLHNSQIFNIASLVFKNMNNSAIFIKIVEQFDGHLLEFETINQTSNLVANQFQLIVGMQQDTVMLSETEVPIASISKGEIQSLFFELQKGMSNNNLCITVFPLRLSVGDFQVSFALHDKTVHTLFASKQHNISFNNYQYCVYLSKKQVSILYEAHQNISLVLFRDLHELHVVSTFQLEVSYDWVMYLILSISACLSLIFLSVILCQYKGFCDLQ